MISVDDARDGDPVGDEGRIGKIEDDAEKKISFESGRFLTLREFGLRNLEEGRPDAERKENHKSSNLKNQIDLRIGVQHRDAEHCGCAVDKIHPT